MKPDVRWPLLSVTQANLEEKATWISREAAWSSTHIMYFRTAASLLRFAWFDYEILPAAFFQAVAGLEGVLRRYSPDKSASFSKLFCEAVDNGLISDATFPNAEQ